MWRPQNACRHCRTIFDSRTGSGGSKRNPFGLTSGRPKTSSLSAAFDIVGTSILIIIHDSSQYACAGDRVTEGLAHWANWSNAGAPVDQLSADPKGPRGGQDSRADVAIDPCAEGQLKRGLSCSRPDRVAAHNDPFTSGRRHELSN